MTVSNDYEFSIPPRSHLYSLEPIGIGTPYVESLTSYITRLAQVHWVSVKVLLSKKFALVIKKSYIAYMLNSVHPGLDPLYKNAHTLNGIDTRAKDWVKATEELTLRIDLRSLTLLNWSNILPIRQLNRQHKAWCPKCYEEWQLKEQPMYEPLLWALDTVTVCPKHHFSLSTCCLQCSQKQRMLSGQSRPAYCLKCEHWLGDLSTCPPQNSNSIGQREFAWQIWAATNVGDLLASQSSPPTREKVSEAILACIKCKTDGNIAAFARMLNSPKNTVWLWQSGEVLPPLRELLRICHLVGVSLVDLLADEFFLEKLDSSIYAYPVKALNAPKSSCKPFDRIKIEKVLEEELLSHKCPPPSAQEVASRLNTSARELRKHFPELCSAISRKASSYRYSKQQQQQKKISGEVKDIVLKLHSKGISITQANVEKELSQPGSIRNPIARQTLKQLRHDLTYKVE